MRVLACLLLSLAACGTVAGSGVDAGSSIDAASIDAPPSRCNLVAPFGSPTSIADINTTANDGQGHLSSDRLTLYFVSDRAGGPGAEDLYVATRASETATFGTPIVIANVNSASFEEGAVISADGLTLYFSSARSTTHDLFVATRTTVAGAFAAPTLLLNVNSTGPGPGQPRQRRADHAVHLFGPQRQLRNLSRHARHHDAGVRRTGGGRCP